MITGFQVLHPTVVQINNGMNHGLHTFFIYTRLSLLSLALSLVSCQPYAALFNFFAKKLCVLLCVRRNGYGIQPGKE